MNKIKTIIIKYPFYSFISFSFFIGFLLSIDYPKLITYYSGLTNQNYKLIHIPKNFFNDERFIQLDKHHNISIYNSENLMNYQKNTMLIMCPKRLKKARCNKHKIVTVEKLPAVIKYYFETS